MTEPWEKDMDLRMPGPLRSILRIWWSFNSEVSSIQSLSLKNTDASLDLSAAQFLASLAAFKLFLHH